MAEWFGALPDVRIPVVCDVDSNIVGPVTKMVTESQGKAPVLVSDIRRVLDDKSIDAVVMATPIHWHAPGTILACKAGKDVYVEKPASQNV
jgi:predicted dehydrogenase